jgi:hypothetical protein
MFIYILKVLFSYYKNYIFLNTNETMETANKNQFDSSLIKSENFNEENQATNTLSNYLKSFSKRPDGKDSNKNSELVSLIESSSAKWNINDSNNDISFGLKNLGIFYILLCM